LYAFISSINLAPIALILDEHYLISVSAQNSKRPISAAVVNDNDLSILIGLPQDALQSVFAKVGPIENRHNH
jgi:hypothetical protein